jgi:hypothetical protein
MCTVCGYDNATIGSTPVSQAGSKLGVRRHEHVDHGHAGHDNDHESDHRSRADVGEHLTVEASGSRRGGEGVSSGTFSPTMTGGGSAIAPFSARPGSSDSIGCWP